MKSGGLLSVPYLSTPWSWFLIMFSSSTSFSLYLRLSFAEDIPGLSYLGIQGWRVRGWIQRKKGVFRREWREFG